MRQIGEVASEILGGNPQKLYILCGDEYGVKQEYIESLKRYYGGCTEYDSMTKLLSFFKTKPLIPPQPTVYVVRYDSEFAKSLNETSAEYIKGLNIIGTVVCIFDDKKDDSAAEKYLGEYTVTITAMHPRFIRKHLKERFPERMHYFIDSVDFSGIRYGEAMNIVTSAEYLSDAELELPLDVFAELSCPRKYTPAEFSIFFADKDFAKCAEIISEYEDSPSDLYYAMCNALIGIESVLSCPWKSKQSPYYTSANKWSMLDVKTVFGYVYDELKATRTSMSTAGTDSLLYLLEMSIQRYAV